MAHAPEASSPALRFDVIAGLTAAAVVLPKAMAYATVAGLPVSVGLYTAFIPMIVYALLGTSRVLSVSSTTTLAILAGTELGLVVPPDLRCPPPVLALEDKRVRDSLDEGRRQRLHTRRFERANLLELRHGAADDALVADAVLHESDTHRRLPAPHRRAD